MTTPTDPLYNSQQFLTVMGDLETIWDEFTGVGVNVGVYDDGFEYTHEDLAGNYDSSLHFQYNGVTYDPIPTGTNDRHGTAVAGIIGAEGENGVGGVGVAWGVTMTGVRFLGGLPTVDEQIASLQWAQNFDVMNNSWGRTPLYGSYQNLMNTGSSVYNEVFNGMEVAIENGRGGLGTVIMQAAGNDTRDANADGINAVRYTTSIAATELDGTVADYSNFGQSILLSGPAFNYTTDLEGSDGYSSGDYVDGFNGTSAATPAVAGVVALMLEANGDLGWRDVQNILAISASHTGSAYGDAPSGFEQGAWYSNGATNWNGGGMTFNISYGFGMVDAFAAVRMAEAWLTMNGDAQTSANEVEESFSVTDNQTISDFNTITSTLSVSATLRAEDLTVWIDFTHTYVGDLTITLIGPNGESLVLSERQGGGANITTGWAFGVTSLLGTDSVSGTWTLSIQDSAGGDTGFLNSWGLDFYGSTANTNTIHHITDDFFTLSRTTGQTGRQVISDTNGGNDDWINMSAIAGSIFLDLDHTGTNHLRVDGINWATLASGTVIENAYGGDGDDQIRGNSANNEIHGARGNDDLRGYAGNDLLIGGVGDDTLRGQGGADTLEGNAGDDRLEGGDGKDVLKGHNGEDRLFGGSNDDRLLGGNNEDLLKGGDGKDILEGGKGSDVLEGGNGKDTLEGNGGHDVLEGNNGDDLLKGHDGNDVLKGHNSDDTLFGGNGGDKLLGGNGNDRLYGGKGNDTLTGGDHADRFYFSNNDDQDTITDFVNNSDTIYFNDNLWTGTRSVQDVIDDFGSINGGNAEFDFGDGDILIIEGVTNLGQLTNDIEIF